MTRPFTFWGCHEVRESLGVRADTEQALAEHLRTIPAERLALFSPFDLGSVEAFRRHLVNVIEDHLESEPASRVAARHPFRFLRSHLVALPVGMVADDLATLRAGLASVDDSSIYYHVVESPGQRGAAANDIAVWVEEELGLPGLGAQLAAVDPFVAGLARTRALLVETLDLHAGGVR